MISNVLWCIWGHTNMYIANGNHVYKIKVFPLDCEG